ncbi:Translin, partial [Atractiella rhizophila]
TSTTRTQTIFQSYKDSLNKAYDRRERLIKTSRDVTIHSKRLIFHLHRVKSSPPTDVFRGALEQTREIYGLWRRVGEEVEAACVEEDMKGMEWRFGHAWKSGLQEFIESQLLYHWLFLLLRPSNPDIAAYPPPPIRPSLPPNILLTPTDWMEGMADFTGEVMRLSVAGWGADLKGVNMADLVRAVLGEMLKLEPSVPKKDRDKLVMVKQNLRKIEEARYNAEIRKAENVQP